jgi:hypothetical protein
MVVVDVIEQPAPGVITVTEIEETLISAGREEREECQSGLLIGCRPSNCPSRKSVTAPRAAEKASLALTCDFGAVCEPPVGSKTRTTASQNVIRSKNHIARPRFPAAQPSSWPQVTSIVSARSQNPEVPRGNDGLRINERNPYVGVGLRLPLDETVAGL